MLKVLKNTQKNFEYSWTISESYKTNFVLFLTIFNHLGDLVSNSGVILDKFSVILETFVEQLGKCEKHFGYFL